MRLNKAHPGEIANLDLSVSTFVDMVNVADMDHSLTFNSLLG